VTGDISRALQFENLYDFGFQVCLTVSILLGFVLNFAMFWCTIVNSPLDLTVAGQFKAISQTIVGLFVFGGIKLTMLNSVGLIVNTIGGLWYARIKANEGGKGDGGGGGGGSGGGGGRGGENEEGAKNGDFVGTAKDVEQGK